MAIAPPLSSSTRVLAWSQLGDETLARRAAAGNEAAFTALYERYRGPLLGYCRSILLDTEDADDATQSTLENALRALPSRDAGRPLRPWLYRIAHNEAVSILRRRRSHDELGPATEPAVSGPEILAEQRGRLELLLEDLRSLPERQRGALVMRELNGLSYEEIGSALGLSEANARRAVFDARSALHEAVDGRDADCVAIRRTLSDGDRRSVRARRIRAHLRSCDQCLSFQVAIQARRVDLPALAPWLAGAAAAGALGLGSGAAGGGGSALIGVGGGGLGWSALPAAAKSAAVVAVLATTGTAATIELKQATRPSRPATRETAAPARAPAPYAQLAAAAAARAMAQASAARAEHARAVALHRHQSSAGRVTLTAQSGQPALRLPRPVSVAVKTPPLAARPPVKSSPPPATVPRPPPSAGTPSSPEQTAAQQKLQLAQGQIQAAIAMAQAAEAAGRPGAMQDAGTLVAATISSVKSMIAGLLSSVGIRLPSSVADAPSYPGAGQSPASVTAPAQQMLSTIAGLLSGLRGR